MDVGARLARTWRSFRSSLLFIPSIMTLAALVLFAVTSIADATTILEQALERTGSATIGFLVFAGGAEAAADVLSSIVGTWATIVGVVFSVTLVTIQLSATKYSAQVIPIFENDRLNQYTLGTFTGTFVYSLLVLKTVRVADDDLFVPLIGTNVAILLALVSLFLLIAFIGNITAYIRPTRFVDDYTRTGIKSLPRKPGPVDVEGYRALEGEESLHAEDETEADQTDARTCSVRADMDGYVADIDWELVREALAKGPADIERVVVRTPVAGHVSEDEALLLFVGIEEVPPKLERRLRRAFGLSAANTGGDPKQVLDTLADIGVTALSGGATDVGVAKTALQNILRLTGAALQRVDDTRMWAVQLEGREVPILLEHEAIHTMGFHASRRIMHKALKEGYWDVAEGFTTHISPVLRNGAGSDSEEVWKELMAWFTPLVRGLFDYQDDKAIHDMLRNLRAATAELRQDGHDTHALDVEFTMLESARDAGVIHKVRGAIAGHGET